MAKRGVKRYMGEGRLMSVQNFNDLHAHYAHDVVVAQYTDNTGNAMGAAIECLDCNEVLLDYDKEEE